MRAAGERPQAVGVVFSDGGRVYLFDPSGLELRWNEKVICHTAHGQDLGRVVQANRVLDEPPPAPLKKVIRRATDLDHERVAENKAEARKVMRVFREVLRQVGVRVKPVAAEIAFDGSRVLVSYEAAKRPPEIGAVQAELARRLRRRVELRAVGPRESARVCGDFGLCGTKHCCRRFPSHEAPITLRMAKDQDLSVATGRITGLCGRLRCCLAYEHPLYKSFRERAPRVGRRVATPDGEGVVTGYSVLSDACTVELEGGNRRISVSIDACRELAERPRRR